jgi:hypothetical protein
MIQIWLSGFTLDFLVRSSIHRYVALEHPCTEWILQPSAWRTTCSLADSSCDPSPSPWLIRSASSLGISPFRPQLQLELRLGLGLKQYKSSRVVLFDLLCPVLFFLNRATRSFALFFVVFLFTFYTTKLSLLRTDIDMALTRRSVVCSAVCLALLVGFAYAGHDHEHVGTVNNVNIDNMSLEELDTQLQVHQA